MCDRSFHALVNQIYLLFWNVVKRGSVVIDVAGQSVGPILHSRVPDSWI